MINGTQSHESSLWKKRQINGNEYESKENILVPSSHNDSDFHAIIMQGAHTMHAFFFYEI